MPSHSLKVFLLNPPYFPKFSRNSRSPGVSKGGCVYYPFWLAYTTGWLEKQGFTCQLVDAAADCLSVEDVIQKIQLFKPDLIVTETATPSVVNDFKVVSELKQAWPNAFYLMTGTHVTALPEESLQQCIALDAVARGEMDFTVWDAAVHLEAKKPLSEVLGLSYVENQNGKRVVKHNAPRPLITGEQLNEFPFIAEVYQKHLKIENYFYPSIRYPEIQIISTRGCPFKCTYCVLPRTLTTHDYRMRSVKSLADEFEWIEKNLPELNEIMMEDDTFTVDKKWTRDFCDELIKRNIKTVWSCNARADVDLETMKKMKQAGCRLLCVGVESAEQQILNNIKKGTNIEKIRQFFKDARQANVLTHGCFMLGNPGETKETIQKTIQFAKELDPDTAQFFPIMVYPGTEAYEHFKKLGQLTTEDYGQWLLEGGEHRTIVTRPGLTDKELVEWCDEARRQFYTRPRYVMQKVVQSIMSPKEGQRTLKSAKTFMKYLKMKPLKTENTSIKSSI